jgi:hypothetical protein
MAAEAQQHAGMALGHQVQRVAQMKAGDRAPRALELMRLARRATGGEDEGGAVQTVFQARGHDADHAFVETGVEHAQRGRRLEVAVDALGQQRFGNHKGLVAHAALDLAALAVDAVQQARELIGARRRRRSAGIRCPASCPTAARPR